MLIKPSQLQQPSLHSLCSSVPHKRMRVYTLSGKKSDVIGSALHLFHFFGGDRVGCGAHSTSHRCEMQRY